MTSLAKSVATLAGGNAVAQGITLLGLPLLSRIYLPEEFGVLAAFVALAALLGVFATLRYDLAIVLPEAEIDALALRFATRRIVVGASILTLLVTIAMVCFGSPGVMPEVSPSFLWLGVFVLLVGETSILNFWFTRQQHYRRQSSARITQAAVTVAVQVVLGLVWPPSAGGLILGAVAGQLACVAVLTHADDSRSKRHSVDAERRRTVLQRYRRMPLLNGPNALADAAQANGINALIAARSVDALGQFSMALRLVQAPVQLIGGAISQVFYPQLARAGRGHLSPVVRASLRKSLLLGALPMALVFIAAPQAVPWILGDNWSDAGKFAQILTPWLYVNLATAPVSTTFLVAERQGLLLVFALAYMAAPLACLALMHGSLALALTVMSAAMSVLLVVFIVLVLVVARDYDRVAP